VLLFAVGMAVGLASPAGAEVAGGCTATLAGQNVGPLSSTKAGDAIDVNRTDQIVAASTSSAPIDGYKVQLEMGGFKWTVAKGAANGNSWSRAVSVNKYASHGVGLYKVIGSSTGAGACTGAVLVNVKGKSPLSTTAGMVGLAMTGIGGVGVAASAVRAVRKSAAVSGGGHVLALLTMALVMGMAAAMTSSSSDAHMAALGVPAMVPSATEARAGWRPRLSVLGMLSGALGGLGLIVLLQQYAVAYPTRGLALTGMLGGALLSLLLTNLLPLLFRGRRDAGTDEPVAAQPAASVEAIDLTDSGVGETAAAEAAATWVPTHIVPPSGLSAWTEPDDASGIPAEKLDPGLEVAVIEESGSWAHICCSNGWSAWVEAPQLLAMQQQ
jgi:hypothetical protein